MRPLRALKKRPVIVGIGVVIVAAVIVTAIVLVRLSGTRNAPATARYSLDANPNFYASLAGVPRSSRSAQVLGNLQSQAVAGWLDTDAAQAADDIRTVTARSRVNGTIPVFVTYAIPDRDLGGQSAGGLDAAGYRSYITAVSQAIGDTPAIVVVEPDALAHVPDITDAAARDTRISLLAYALDTFHGNARTAVYLDAGNSAWRPAGDMAGLIRQVADKTQDGVPGIALNVANFRPDDETARYAAAINTAYGAKLYALIDSSRNGAVPKDKGYCNPAGERLGRADATFDRNAAVEEVFIKTPGESDGQCGISAQRAGVFDTSLLLTQIGVN